MRLEGGIFDIDGVLLDTPHERAWREVLEELMAGPWRALAPQSTYTPYAFTSAVYQEHIAGKPREEGAAAALAYFHMPDPDQARTREYAAAKQARLERLAAGSECPRLRRRRAVSAGGEGGGCRTSAPPRRRRTPMSFLRAVSVGAFASFARNALPVRHRSTYAPRFVRCRM